MTEEKEEKHEGKDKKKEGLDWSVPFCTKAASAEHFRASDEDEPCDDARAEEFEEEKDEA